MTKYLIPILLLATQLASCQSNNTASSTLNNDAELLTKDYWFDGKAEINTYQLKQNRYNTLHDGTAMLIFVTEDFLPDEQVKNDTYQNKNSTSILKKIEQRKFNTGIYDYTEYSTTFTPIQLEKYKKSFKVTANSQDWCGTIFSQYNAQVKGYKGTVFSYFETEGDKVENIKDGIVEGELYTRLRMNPDLLPTGAFNLIPEPIVSMLMHYPLESFKATGSINQYTGEIEGENLEEYVVEIPDLKRTVKIVFESAAPFTIVAFYDSYPSIFDQKIRTTEAVLINQTKLDYWNKHSKEDETLRKTIKLEE